MELHEAGQSEREIVEAVGCSKGTVGSVKAAQKQDSRENGREETTKPPHAFHDETTDVDDKDAPWNQGFSEED